MHRGIAPALDRRDLAALLLLAAVALPLRLIALDANPSLDVFRGLLTDEGAWAHNARQAAIFGRWIMDDHNPGLTIAPVYSAALHLTYALLGVGFVSTRLVGALSSAALCIAAYLWMRGRVGRMPAVAAGLALAVDAFGLAHSRIAMVEPLQTLLLLGCAAGIVRAAEGGRGASAAGAAAAIALWLAIATKLTAIALAPAILLFWMLQLAFGGDRARLPRFAWRPVLAFAIASAAGLAIVALAARAAPDVANEFLGNLRSATSPRERETLVLTLPLLQRLGLPELGLPYGTFLELCAPLLALVAALACARIAGASDVARTRASVGIETFCACWLAAVLGFVAVQSYRPERRFLAALPPLAILAALALRPGALAIPARSESSRARLALAGVVAGAFIGLYAHELAGSGGSPRAGALAARTLALCTMASGALGAALFPLLPARRIALPRAVQALAFAIVLGAGVARFARDARDFDTGVRDLSRALAELTADWDERDRVLVGAEAYTYALETKLFAFTVRLDRPAGIPQNPDGWERFDPRIAMVYGPIDESRARAHDLLPWRSFEPRRFRLRGEVVEPVVWVFVKRALCGACDTSGEPVFPVAQVDQGA